MADTARGAQTVVVAGLLLARTTAIWPYVYKVTGANLAAWQYHNDYVTMHLGGCRDILLYDLRMCGYVTSRNASEAVMLDFRMGMNTFHFCSHPLWIFEKEALSGEHFQTLSYVHVAGRSLPSCLSSGRLRPDEVIATTCKIRK